MIYYGAKGISLNPESFKANLSLYTEDGKYNLLAQLLSDNSHFPIRVAIFSGPSKADKLYSIREFGNQCILYSLDEVLRYGDVLNIIQADERNRIVERKEVPLFENDAFREAVINAFVHNSWILGNEPMITVYSDRIEILSRGALPKDQTIDGFYKGFSIPVNPKLSEIFLQLHISEKTGRGIPSIISKYGKEAFTIGENTIQVTIPFKWLNVMNEKQIPPKDYFLNETQTKIITEIRNNPNITKSKLGDLLHLSLSTIEKNISYLKSINYIERIGSNKSGYWSILEQQKTKK